MKRILFLLSFFFFSFPAYSSSYGPFYLIAPTATDGDTIKADVQVWPSLTVDAAIRVIGVDTPEISQAKCPEEKAAGIAARDFTNVWISAHVPLVINTVRPDKYSGRYDAVVVGNNGDNLAADLIKSGHGRSYRGGARQSWCP